MSYGQEKKGFCTALTVQLSSVRGKPQRLSATTLAHRQRGITAPVRPKMQTGCQMGKAKSSIPSSWSTVPPVTTSSFPTEIPPREPVEPSGFPGTNRIGDGETIDSNAPNGVAFARDANGDFTETAATPDTPGVTCFVTGTLIETEEGPLPVCALRPGIRLATLDNGWQPLLARRETTITPAMMRAFSALCPVHIPVGLCGAQRPLDVSAAHSLFWSDPRAELLFNSREVFVPARNLIGHGALPSPLADKTVTYHHLLLPQHEVIMAHGVWSESLFMGDIARRGRMALDQWHIGADVALRDIMHRSTARPVLRGFEAEVLLRSTTAAAA